MNPGRTGQIPLSVMRVFPVSKLSLFFASLTMAVPATALSGLLIYVFFKFTGESADATSTITTSTPVMMWVLAGITLAFSLFLSLLPFGILIFVSGAVDEKEETETETETDADPESEGGLVAVGDESDAEIDIDEDVDSVFEDEDDDAEIFEDKADKFEDELGDFDVDDSTAADVFDEDEEDEFEL